MEEEKILKVVGEVLNEGMKVCDVGNFVLP